MLIAAINDRQIISQNWLSDIQLSFQFLVFV